MFWGTAKPFPSVVSAHIHPPTPQHHKRLWFLHILAAIFMDVSWYLDVGFPFPPDRGSWLSPGCFGMAQAWGEAPGSASRRRGLQAGPRPGFTVALMGICLVHSVIFIAVVIWTSSVKACAIIQLALLGWLGVLDTFWRLRPSFPLLVSTALITFLESSKDLLVKSSSLLVFFYLVL
jgi:hypothetical protein